MVNEQVIKEVIDIVVSKHLLLKCGKGGFNKQVLSVFNKFREETKNWTHEKALYVTNKGEIVWSKEGDGNSVVLDTRTAWSESQKNGLLHIEHNHPIVKGLENFPSLLSRDDLKKMISSTADGYLFRSITAEMGGSRMSISKTRDFPLKSGIDSPFESEVLTLINKYDAVVSEYAYMYRDKIGEYTGMDKWEFAQALGSDTSWGSDEYRDNISRKAIKEIGSLQSHLEKSGLLGEFEDVGLILKVSGEVA